MLFEFHKTNGAPTDYIFYGGYLFLACSSFRRSKLSIRVLLVFLYKTKILFQLKLRKIPCKIQASRIKFPRLLFNFVDQGCVAVGKLIARTEMRQDQVWQVH